MLRETRSVRSARLATLREERSCLQTNTAIPVGSDPPPRVSATEAADLSPNPLTGTCSRSASGRRWKPLVDRHGRPTTPPPGWPTVLIGKVLVHVERFGKIPTWRNLGSL